VRINKSWHYFIIALFCLLPFVFLLYQAWYSPKIEFLIPSLKGKWILYSAEKISGVVEFRRLFRLDDVPSEYKIKIRAMRQFSMVVNGQAVEEDSQREQHNWKFALKYDIASFFQKGDNSIVIRVSNPEGPPVLLVEGPKLNSSNGEIKLSSNTDWEAAPDPSFTGWVKAVPTYKDDIRLGENKGPIQKSPRYPIYMMIFGAYILFILLAINPWRIFYRLDFDLSKRKINRIRAFLIEQFSRIQARFPKLYRSLSLIPFFVIIIIMLVVNVHNIITYPYTRSGFDWGGHVEYIRYMASNWQTPIATEGWEMFQPPFYYFLSAIVYRLFGGEASELGALKAVQIMGMLSGVANALFAWLILRKLFKKNYLIQLLGFSSVAFLPMCLYMNPLISNEVFSASIISLAIYLLVRYGFEDQIKLHYAIILGIVIGLALLSKYTSVFIFLTVATVMAIRILLNPSKRRRELLMLGIFLIIVFALSGWVYIRNLIIFHDPFIGNWDKASGFHYEQHHGYRTLGFYLKFGSVFLHAPERSRWSSFWDGKYGSMWMDTHGSFLNIGDDEANLYGSIIIYLALLPSVSILLGFYQSLKSAFKSARSNPDFALIMVSVLTVISLISFTMEIPFFSTIKAFFFLSLLPVMSVFAGKGLYTMSRKLGKFRFIIYVNLIIMYILIINLFWYRGT
jgi:4-amino-4-deoxy-L-arabinose transferase-like glycosyltransferase